MKRILIIAGPNGAGKTTFAAEFLPNEAGCPEFVNADLIAAGRLMLARIGELVAAGKSFAFETTRSWLRLIPRWRFLGYRVKLYFLTLPDADFALRRVEQRVRLGGHAIPPETVRRRFVRSLENLRQRYLGIVDEWGIYDGCEDPPRQLETGDHRPPDKIMEDSAEYRPQGQPTRPVKPLDDPDFIGAEAALRRASAKAVARARAAGLEPVVRSSPPVPEASSSSTDH
jgi:predicted ABC-type ATPase